MACLRYGLQKWKPSWYVSPKKFIRHGTMWFRTYVIIINSIFEFINILDGWYFVTRTQDLSDNVDINFLEIYHNGLHKNKKSTWCIGGI